MIKRDCAECGKSFTAHMSHAKYCSDQCRWRAHKRETYAERKKNGLCPQCGGKMADEQSSYCRKCQTYFRRRYYKNAE